MSEENAGATATETVVENEEKVLSQEEVQETEKSSTNTEVKSETKPEKTEEERNASRDAYIRRQEHKAWRKKLSEIQNQDHVSDAVNKAASEEGFDPADEGNKKQLNLIKKSVLASQRTSDKEKTKVLSQASSGILTETLKTLDYDPVSPQGRYLGQYLFDRFGVENPDIYSDEKIIGDEIGKFVSGFKSKVKDNPIQSAIIKKAATSKAGESRNDVSTDKTELKEFSQKHGVSIERAAVLMEKKKKIPSWVK